MGSWVQSRCVVVCRCRAASGCGGAKNLVPKAMVAALLAPGVSVLRNVPDVADVAIVAGLLGLHGLSVERDVEGGTMVVDAARVANPDVSEVLTHGGTSRIPVLFCGPLLHRLGRAFIPDLGGCRIGDRPIDFHLDALRASARSWTSGPTGWTSPRRTVCAAPS